MPYMTPIFSRSWLMKMTMQPVLLTTPASFLSAWLIRRATTPTLLSPISPSSSLRGSSAATESMTTTSSAPERTSCSVISSACSPVSGWEMSSSSMLTPRARAYAGSSACSTSMYAASPPFFCALATMCSARVVLPQLSGPYISTMRPRGTPPMPSARSSESEPVEMASTFTGMSSPRRIMAPLP